MIWDIFVAIVLLATPFVAWRAWLALFPGISLRADYGIRGGWFGTPVSIKGAASNLSSLWRYVSS
jgi:hypothetical protein